MTAGKARAAESQDRLDLLDRDTAAPQTLCDPQIGNAPIRGRKTLANLQAMQPAGIDAAGAGGSERTVAGSAWGKRHTDRRASRWKAKWGALEQRGGPGGQVRPRVPQDGPRRVTVGLAACGLLVGESSQSSTMAPVRAGRVCAVLGRPLSGHGGSYGGFQWTQTDTNPGLQMAGLVRSTTEGSCPLARMVSMMRSSAPSRSTRM